MNHRPLSGIWSSPLVAVALLAMTCGAASPAAACSCAAAETPLLAPANGAVDVPTNARIWIGGLYFGYSDSAAHELFHLEDSTGAVVATTATEIEGNNELAGVLTPDEPLAAGESYSIISSTDGLLGQFTVGDGTDDDAPAVPEELDRTSSADARIPGMMSSCGYTDTVTIELDTDGLVVVALIEGQQGFDDGALDGPVSDLTVDAELVLGSAGCTWSWPAAEPGSSTTVSYGAYDLAGNFSGWSDDDTITIPAAGCTCSADGTGSTSSAFLGALALVALVTRRHRHGSGRCGA